MATRCLLGARPTAEDPDGSVCMRPNPHSKGYAGWALSWRWWRSLSAERPSHRPRRWLGPWPLAVPTRASPQCLTRTHAPQSGCMTVLGYRCTAFNWGAISRPQASYTGLHPTDARSKSEYSLTHSLTHLWSVIPHIHIRTSHISNLGALCTMQYACVHYPGH